MAKHSHRFVEEYTGLMAFGLDRKTDEYTLTCYLQKFSDDELMALLRTRMSQDDILALSHMLMGLMKKYMTDEEYHQYFLKEED